MMGKEEMDAMLNGGFDSPPPVPPIPQNAQRFQLADGGGGGAYSPVQRDGPNASSSAVWERTHAKRRSGSGRPPGPDDEEMGGRQAYGPLGPLGPSR